MGVCDTIVALSNSTKDGSVIFAKNSDRQPDEPHVMIRIPRQKHDLESEKYVKATYIQIPQVAETYEVVLLKPSWIWGCEMGWNEHCLNIGNEAVFTKEKHGKAGLIGMDFVRIALERCKTSDEAVDTITGLLEIYGQGGNCGYEKQFTYHNSYLIADKHSAWVLETAGKYWAAKRINDTYCISNRLTMGKDFDKCHPETIKHAVENRWCKDENDFDFAKCYSNKLFTHFSGSLSRRKACESVLEQERGNISVDTMKKILRSHHAKVGGKLFRKPSVSSVCMHAGGLIGDQTTGSYIASLNKEVCTYWVTGASAPCISAFKPVWLVDGMPIFDQAQETKATEYWKLREKLHRMIIAGLVDLDSFISERNALEKEFDELLTGLKMGSLNEDKLRETAKYAFDKEAELIAKFIGQGKQDLNRCKSKGSIFYNRFWKKHNRKLFP